MNSDAYISVKLNNCSGIWFTKCISISVFIIENHFVTPFHQTNAQNRIRIISVFLKIEFFFLKSKINSESSDISKKRPRSNRPYVRFLSISQNWNWSGLADGRAFDNIETQARKSVILAAIFSSPISKLKNLNIVTGKGVVMTRYINSCHLIISVEKSKFQGIKMPKVMLSCMNDLLELFC